ncbi:Uncharacterised protein [Mycobacterium tuberculosis]|nr:Uncharacterised protein [Mycobacterium tuberculosis]
MSIAGNTFPPSSRSTTHPAAPDCFNGPVIPATMAVAFSRSVTSSTRSTIAR